MMFTVTVDSSFFGGMIGPSFHFVFALFVFVWVAVPQRMVPCAAVHVTFLFILDWRNF